MLTIHEEMGTLLPRNAHIWIAHLRFTPQKYHPPRWKELSNITVFGHRTSPQQDEPKRKEKKRKQTRENTSHPLTLNGTKSQRGNCQRKEDKAQVLCPGSRPPLQLRWERASVPTPKSVTLCSLKEVQIFFQDLNTASYW